MVLWHRSQMPLVWGDLTLVLVWSMSLMARVEDHVAVRCRPRTAEFYRTAVEKYLVPRLGKLPALAVDHARVTELHHALRDGR